MPDRRNVGLEPLLGSDHYASLTGELKCHCGGYLEPPIRLCTRGHGACKRCRRLNHKCPVCEEEFTETRSIALEGLADKLQFPCPHKGCLVRSPLRSLQEHVEECNLRPTTCFMNKVYQENCSWQGRASDWLEHCVSTHSDRVTELPFVTFSEVWAPRQRDPVMRYHLLRCYERVFNVYQIYDAKSGKMMWSVVVTGEDHDDSCSFYFDLEMFNPEDHTRKICFRQPCKNGLDMDILEATQNVLLPLEQILYMMDKDGFIHFNLRVSRKEDGFVPNIMSNMQLVSFDSIDVIL